MAGTGRKFVYKVRLEGDDKLSPTVKQAEGSFKKFGKTLSNVSAGQVAAVAGLYIGIKKLADGFVSLVANAIAAESSLLDVGNSMKTAGDYSAEAVTGVRDWSNALQDSLRVEKEVTEGAFSLAKSFVGSTEAAKELTEAAFDFAKGAKIEFTEAVRRLGRAVHGSTDDVAKFVPEIKGLTKSQLLAGDATALLAERFKGFAEGSLGPAEKKIKDVSLAFDQMQEDMGGALTTNTELIDNFAGLTTTLKEATPAIVAMASGVVTVVNALISTSTAIGTSIGNLITYKDTIAATSLEIGGLEISQKALEFRANRLGVSIATVRQQILSNLQAKRQLNATTNQTADSFESLANRAARATLELARLEQASREGDDALSSLGAAIGVVTSSDLEAEMDRIQSALERVRDSGRVTGNEFVDLEARSAPKLRRLQERINSLKSGLGDLVTVASDRATPAVIELAESFSEAADGADAEAKAIGRLIVQTQRLVVENKKAADTSRLVKGQGGTRFKTSSISNGQGYGLSKFEGRGSGSGTRVAANGTILRRA